MCTKESKLELIDQYKKLSPEDKKRVRNRFLDEAEFSLPAFYQKMRDNSFRGLERSFLQRLINDVNRD